MTKEYERKHLPDAVYLDTNVLREAGYYLNKPWMSELRALSSKYGISLCVTELVLEEWCEYIFEELQKQRQKIISALGFLKQFEIKTPDIGESFIELPDRNQLRQIIRNYLNNAGFEIIKNWSAPIEKLIDEAVTKRPPFESGGKGFRDAVIVESYSLHAADNFKNSRILVVTKDNAILRTQERFKQRNVDVTFVFASEVVSKLNSLLDDELSSLLAEQQKQLLAFVESRKKQLFDFVNNSPLKFNDFWLQISASEDDRIEGTIERILSAKPTRIDRVVGGASHFREQVDKDRYPIDVWIELELEVIVSQYNTLSSLFKPKAVGRPQMISEETPLSLEDREPLEKIEKTLTIKRNIKVEATVENAGVDNGVYKDFRLDRVH